jgi:predicted nucleic acid-binding protein
MIISNSTPLINFSAIRRMEILRRLFGKIHIPPAVENELFVKGKKYSGTEILRQADFIEVLEKPENTVLCDVFKNRTG